ncbi:M23 family metallopeptidase [Curtobacterium sp. SP.BCo]|uniref:M23 family metallopeptidase n=1 Tax=Curtobacterium sp. SP.BCo TaxID=3435229 RepID=UPI003F734A41
MRSDPYRHLRGHFRRAPRPSVVAVALVLVPAFALVAYLVAFLVTGPTFVTVTTTAVVPVPDGRAAAPARTIAETGAPWIWPTGIRVVSRPWEAPADDYSAGHRGLDVPASIGDAAVAVDDGTVSFAGSVAGRGVVTIDHGDGLRSTLDSVVPSVATGDAVAQGDTVGRVAVGHCPASDPCLHLGARLDDRYVDPTPYLPAAAWPVLLPDSAWPG